MVAGVGIVCVCGETKAPSAPSSMSQEETNGRLVGVCEEVDSSSVVKDDILQLFLILICSGWKYEGMCKAFIIYLR